MFLKSILRKNASQKRFHLSGKAQSFVELALILPILFLILVGLVEVSFYIGAYLDVLDLTREASRFASVRDPFDTAVMIDQNCQTDFAFDFFYDTACIFAQPSCDGASDPFCRGLNTYFTFDPALDDVVISVFTVTNWQVSDAWPKPDGWWALSNHDGDPSNDDAWMRNCEGDEVRSSPHYSVAEVNSILAVYNPTLTVDATPSPRSKGYVAIELFHCYNQILDLPVFTDIVPNPIQIHAYTIMSLPAAQPTATTTSNP